MMRSPWIISLPLFLAETLLTTLLVKGSVVLLDADGKETNQGFVIEELLLQLRDYRGWCSELYVAIVSGMTLFDRVSQLLAPVLDVRDLATTFGDQVMKFLGDLFGQPPKVRTTKKVVSYETFRPDRSMLISSAIENQCFMFFSMDDSPGFSETSYKS